MCDHAASLGRPIVPLVEKSATVVDEATSMDNRFQSASPWHSRLLQEEAGSISSAQTLSLSFSSTTKIRLLRILQTVAAERTLDMVSLSVMIMEV